MVQRDMANDNVFQPDGQFRQVVLKDPDAKGGMHSLWFTKPDVTFTDITTKAASLPKPR